jgi:hypothetical protein
MTSWVRKLIASSLVVMPSVTKDFNGNPDQLIAGESGQLKSDLLFVHGLSLQCLND